MGRMVHLLAAGVQRAQADAEAGPCQGSAGIVRALDDLEVEVRRCAAVVGAVQGEMAELWKIFPGSGGAFRGDARGLVVLGACDVCG